MKCSICNKPIKPTDETTQAVNQTTNEVETIHTECLVNE
jgi:hypothetical protein